MTKIASVFSLLLILIISPAVAEPPSGFKPSEFQYRDGKVFYGRSYLENFDGMQVLHLYGTPFEMGYAHTKLLAYRYPETKEKVLGDLMPPIPWGPLGQLISKVYIDYKGHQLDSYLPPEIREELQGLVEPFIPYGGTYNYALFLHAIYDLYKDIAAGGCSGFIAQGKATVDGKTYFARNFDLAKKGTFDDYKVIIFRHPDKGYAYASIAWPTMTGVVSGMNEKGLTLALHSATGRDTASQGLPANLMVAYILQKAATVKEAEEMVKKTPSMGTFILMAADQTGDAAAIEFSAKKVGIRRAEVGAQNFVPLQATNHYLTPEWAADPKNQQRAKYGDSRYRWERLNSLLSANQGQIDPLRCAQILRDRLDLLGRKLPLGDENALNPAHNSHSVIFCPSDLTFWVARAPMAWGEYRGFSFKNEIVGTPRHGGIPLPANIPADPYIQTKEYQQELWAWDYLEKAKIVAKLGYHREVEDLARRALLMDPENYRVRKFLALWLASRGEYQKALENTAFLVYQTMGVPEEKALTHAYRGMLQDLLGNREEALREYKIALEYDASPLANELTKKGLKEPYTSFIEK